MAQQFHDMPINHDWPQAIRDWHFVAKKAADARDETSEARFTMSTRTRESFANMSQMAQDARQRQLDRIDAIEYAQWQALAAIDALGAEMIAEWEQEQAEQAAADGLRCDNCGKLIKPGDTGQWIPARVAPDSYYLCGDCYYTAIPGDADADARALAKHAQAEAAYRDR